MSDGTQQVRDEYLALRLRHGEPAAFAELVRTLERPLLYYLTKLVGADAALDVLQDTWVAAVGGRYPAVRAAWLPGRITPVAAP